MSKSAQELLEEFSSQELITDDFELHILKVKIDDNGEIEHAGNALTVTSIEFDHQSKECLLHYEEGATNYVTVAEAKVKIVDSVLSYEVCASQIQERDDAFVRLDTPLIGFGENVDMQCFFAICRE
ncbi:hypothetical protein WN093_16095 [Gammaproteobacteria bacterium AS21]